MIRKARPAARLLMLDPAGDVLMFRFAAAHRPAFWATPGGACDPGESYADAARREMFEETGWQLDPGPERLQRIVEFTTLEGEDIWSDERYFVVHVPERRIDTAHHTELELRVMQQHRWWSIDELHATTEIVFPEDLPDMLAILGA